MLGVWLHCWDVEGPDGTQAKGLQGTKLDALAGQEAGFCVSQLFGPVSPDSITYTVLLKGDALQGKTTVMDFFF